MIISKDSVSRETLIALMQYSLTDECQFLCAVKPNTNIGNDHVFQGGSVISFLKLEEKVCMDIDAENNRAYYPAFSVKVLVEDQYWVLGKGEKEGGHYRCGQVPPEVHKKVTEILNPES